MFHGYRVSNTGRCQWNDNGVWREKKEKTCRAYRCVTLKVDGKQKEIAVSLLVHQLFGVERPRFIVPYEEAMRRIADKHGNIFTPVSEYKQASAPMRFRCSVCGSEFEETPQHMTIYDEPCKVCKKRRIEEERQQRQQQRAEEREDRALPDSDAHCVYTYTFADGCKYIGLTCVPKQRDAQHRCYKSSAVYQHHIATGLPIPKPIYIAERISASEARLIESQLIDEAMRDDKDKCLNRVEGGSLGGLYIPHTIEEARKKAARYDGRKALRDGCRWAYEMLSEHGELPCMKAPKTINILHTIEDARRMKGIYKIRAELRRRCGWAYTILKEAGELPDKINLDVSDEEIALALEKYPTRSLLYKFAHRAYGAARRKGMLPPKEPKIRKETQRRCNIIEHTLENALTILARCKTRSKLWNYPWAYGMLKEHGLLPNKDLANCWHGGRRPKWGRKAHRTSAELTIKWG